MKKSQKTREREVGSKFTTRMPHNHSVQLEVIEVVDDLCSGCYFYNICLHYYHNYVMSKCGNCSKHERKDGRSIIYKKLS